MRFIKSFFNYILSINTIWGFMIVIALLLALFQHIASTKTPLPLEKWLEGPNKVGIKVVDKDDKVYGAGFTLRRENNSYLAVEQPPDPLPDVPWLAGAEPSPKGGWIFKWSAGAKATEEAADASSAKAVIKGDYEALLDGNKVSGGVFEGGVVEIPLDEKVLAQGDNFLVVRLTHLQSPVRQSRFLIIRDGSNCIFQKLDPDETAPFLKNVSAKSGAVQIAWDIKTYGKYAVSLNEKTLAAGKLVTLKTMTDAAFDYAKTAFNIGLGLVAAMVLFLGLMKVGEQSGVIQMAAKIFRPIIRIMFPDIPENHPANGAILMNITTTVLGLGNAATPFGLKAIMELQKINKYKRVASDSMVMLVGYNTAGFALLPTTLLAIRTSAGCSDPFSVIGPCMFAGLVSTIVAVIATKVYGLLPMFRLEAAVGEDDVKDAASEAPESQNAGEKKQ